ncbi:MAG: metalloregulator ArsR/SmtB family transcription factor [Balneolales bacterium]
MDEFVNTFKVLGEETRLRIVHLYARTHQALCVCELVDVLGLPQYQISRHLRQLRMTEILKLRKQGTWSYYYINEQSRFRKHLYDFIEHALVSDILERDLMALQIRLSHRKNGRCVVGSVPHKEILHQINPDHI